MTQQQFRRIALGMTDAIEGAHMGHPDFRVQGRIFATLQPKHNRGMVVLTPEQQQRLLREAPAIFSAESGAWGRQGCTRVQLEAADDDTVGEAMTLAWQNKVAARRTSKTKPAARPVQRRSSKRA
jgi:hypothetical protein